jgi:hypothetical protein
MSKEKNKNTFRVAALLLVACLISSVMLSGTFAKYTSEYAGQDTALVARWSFGALGGDNNTTNPTEMSLDLFGHLYKNNINTIEENGKNTLIAPGVGGQFTVAMDFLSDVDAKVTVNFAENENSTAKNLPIEYSVVDGTWVTLEQLPAAFVNKLASNYERVTDSSEETFTFTRSDIDDTLETETTTISQDVKWRWAFDSVAQNEADAGTPAFTSSDITDTDFGEASAALDTRLEYILNVSVKAEQLEPEKVTP